MRRPSRILFGALIVLLVLPQSTFASWLMFQHDAQRTGRSPFVSAQSERLKWASDVANGAPSVGADGTIYAGDFALTPDGRFKFRFVPQSPGLTDRAAISGDGTIYTAYGNERLYAFWPDGSERCRFEPGTNTTSGNGTPAIGPDGKIYVSFTYLNPGRVDVLYALDADCREVWRYSGLGDGRPTLGLDGTVYVVGLHPDDFLYAVNPDGTVKAQLPRVPGGVVGTSVGADGTVYVAAALTDLYAIAPTGTIKWRVTQFLKTSVAIGPDGTLYGVVGPVGLPDSPSSDTLVAVDPATGEEKWRFPIGGDGPGGGPIVGADGTVYVGGGYGVGIYAVRGGTVLWHHSMSVSESAGSLAIGGNGTLYVAVSAIDAESGRLLAFGESADDDFGDGSLDLARWSTLVPPPGFSATVAETSQRLEISVGPGAGGAGIVSRCVVTDDFDVQVDYILLNWPANNLHNLRLGAPDLGVGPFGGIGMNRSSFGTELYVGAFSDTGAQVVTGDVVGKLRLVRTGTTLSTYSQNGSSWTLVGSGVATTVATRFSLDIGSGDPAAPGGVTGGFDNFRVNAGTVTCAPPPPPPPPPGNQKPVISNLRQLKSDGSSTIPGGGTTEEGLVLFRADVSDPDGDEVRLEIELRQFTEPFTGVATVETVGSFVASGTDAVISRAGLISGAYHWRARAFDKRGAVSDWGEFGSAGDVDFRVAVPRPSKETTFVVTVSFSGTGRGRIVSRPVGIECGEACSASFPGRSKVILEAEADPGSTFVGWSRLGCPTNSHCRFDVTGNETIVATFMSVPAVTTPRVIYVAVCGAGFKTDDTCRAGRGWYDPRTEFPGFNPLSDDDLDQLAQINSGFDSIGLKIGRVFPSSITLVTGFSSRSIIVEAGNLFFVRQNVPSIVDFVKGVYSPGDLIYLAGHSAGGGIVQDVARKLGKGIPVEMLALVDSIGLDAAIPPNVKRAFNFYYPLVQDPLCFPGGESAIFAKKPQRSVVSNTMISEPRGPEDLDSTCGGHRNMDNDPSVWRPLLDYILSSAAR